MNKNSKDLLKVINLQKFFANKKGILKAVQNVSFTLKEGEIIGLIGESGSGKTTVGRSLIRLYDDYSGFVSLSGEVVSGKKLSAKANLYLHKNMQMIFQDPHTSMNSQKTVFSILEEPLIVNKVLKEKYQDIFSDWKDVKKFFKYTFLKHFKSNELKNILFENTTELNFIQKWKSQLDKINILNENFEEIFSDLFLYLESKQKTQTKIVNEYYEFTKEIFNTYKKSQANLRAGKLDYDEKELIEARKILKEKELLVKNSKETLELNKQIKSKKETLKEFNKIEKETLDKRVNTLKNYLSEFKNNIKLYKQQRSVSTNFKDYIFNLKWYFIYQKSYELLLKNLRFLTYLSIEETGKLIEKQKAYNLAYFNLTSKVFLEAKNSKISLEKKAFLNKYTFEYKNQIEKSNETRNLRINEKNIIIKKISELELKKNSLNNSPSVTEKELNNAKEYLAKAEAIFQKELNVFLSKHNSIIDNYKKKILEAKEIQKNSQIKNDFLDNKFNEIFNKFINNLKERFGNTKKFKNQINSFKTRIFEKKENIKALKIEKTLLIKDIKKLEHLVGIQSNKLSKIFVKEVLLREIIYSALEDVGLLRQFAYRYPHEFSGGQRQRIVIARALITEPKVIIADEPIASLDISIQAQVVNLLKDLCKRRKIGLIFIAHDLSMVEYIADSIIIMHLGQVVERGKTEKIYQNPIHPYTISLFNSIPKMSNANEKFQASNFELDYLSEQNASNPPVLFEVAKDHQVLATKKQFKKWVK